MQLLAYGQPEILANFDNQNRHETVPKTEGCPLKNPNRRK